MSIKAHVTTEKAIKIHRVASTICADVLSGAAAGAATPVVAVVLVVAGAVTGAATLAAAVAVFATAGVALPVTGVTGTGLTAGATLAVADVVSVMINTST
jgi:hypothetical protein